MTKYKIFLSKTALRYFNKLDSKLRDQIRSHLKELEENPFEKRPRADIKQLSGSFNPVFFRLRVGKYRVIYTISNDKIRTTEIMLRSKNYDWLE